MAKRKHSELNDFNPKDRTIGRLIAQFENGVAALSQALKAARIFERQKLGRREKTAKKENKTEVLARLGEEIQVIKSLDIQATAEKYLFKQLLKTKRIAASPAFVTFKERRNIPTGGPSSAAEANVTARLYKSNPVKKVFPGIMDAIRKLLGLEDAPASKPDNSEKKESSRGKSESREPEVKPESDSDGEEGSEIGIDDSEDYTQFDARLAPGSDSENENESESDTSDNPHNPHNPPSYSDISISRSPSPDHPAPKKAKKATSTPTSTTFLPSLTMGGYFSGSESEPEDIEGAAGPPRRKNRMGQQARRALWEKKYGSGANHIKKQRDEEKRSRDSGWDVRRGAMDGSEGPRGRRSGLGPRQRDDFGDRPQRGLAGGEKKNVKDDKPLHPSWEAARKAKEQKSMASFQGKKVVFD